MSSAEIKALRQNGNLEEALQMAKFALEKEPANLWNKRNLSWVHYEYLKKSACENNASEFIHWITELKRLELPSDEKILYEQVAWQIGSILFKITGVKNFNVNHVTDLFKLVKDLPISKPSEAYSFLFKGFHKALKDTSSYFAFADWWDFENFRPEDFQKEKLKDGKEIMAVAEQAYIAYSKQLLNQKDQEGHSVFERTKVEHFSEDLSDVIEKYPKLMYLPYFKAKLLLALDDKDNMLSGLLPFARKKHNDFWVWDILAEALSNEPDKVFACYCKALTCKSPEEMLIGVRLKLASLMIARKLYNEAKTEIILLVNTRSKEGFRTPAVVNTWMQQEWYKVATQLSSNYEFYKNYKPLAESILYGDFPETKIVVEFVNTDKKMLSFITSDLKTGFFKYERFFSKVIIGDVLAVRFQLLANEGPSQVITATKHQDDNFKNEFIKIIEGDVRIKNGNTFGFIEDAFLQPSIINKHHLIDGMRIKAQVIKSYNGDKKKWGWKVINLL